ncbi:MAG TPA: Mov34/MPN/PAD-1 family protein [Pyrinomonadaceae bacterium]|nr:Mov34/MPN/PAD-1 family protein [Pyrinomonadaceae bacterium]
MATSEENLFSAAYAKEDPASWGQEIEAAFAELRRITGGEVRCVHWNDDYVAAAFTVKVDLPSRGPVGGVDIRAEEPVMLVFSRRDYPERAPMVRSDRKDFPVSRLSHLNPVKAGQPPYLCMHRGSYDDWFAEHTLEDVVTRLRGWLRDAARNRLIPEGDRFEPTRINNAIGAAIFSPQSFKNWINEGWKSTGGEPGYGFLLMSLLDRDKRDPVRDGGFPVSVWRFYAKEEDLTEAHKAVSKLNSLISESDSLAPLCFGVLCWSSRDLPITEYFGQLPENVSELLELCRRHNIPLGAALSDYAARDLRQINGLPVILGLVRHQPLIRSDSNIEPLCFVLDGSAPDFTEKRELPEEAQVSALIQRSPLTPEMARNISGTGDDALPGRILLFGGGALGSKLAMHYGRSGHTALTTVDPANLSPHNFVRHALLAERAGQNKAEAIKRSIEAIYEGITESQKPDAHTGSALDLIKGEQRAKLGDYSLLIDATASGMVNEAVVRATLPEGLKVVRCGIADRGKVGLLAVEGPRRNPRVDDVNVLVYDIAIDEPALRQWLERERKQREEQVGAVLDEITIGMSCSSDTMRLADDLVSWHASTFSAGLRKLLNRMPESRTGHLILNYHAEQGDDHGNESLVSRRIPIEPFLVLPAQAVDDWRVCDAGGWQVRIRSQTVREMRERLQRAAPKETGGLMIGVAHSKRRIIYVTRIIDAPPDSKGTSSGFRRGTRRLPQAVDAIKKASGGLLGYVGDWHTHPRGSGRISTTDIKAMLQTKRDFDMAGIPTFILIASHKGFHAYVSVPE